MKALDSDWMKLLTRTKGNRSDSDQGKFLTLTKVDFETLTKGNS